MTCKLSDKAIRTLLRDEGFMCTSAQLTDYAADIAREVLELRKVARQFKRLRERAMVLDLSEALKESMAKR